MPNYLSTIAKPVFMSTCMCRLQRSFVNFNIPSHSKISKVIPSPKEGTKATCSNYHPNSGSLILGKVFEKKNI